MSDVLSRLETIIEALFCTVFQETNKDRENCKIQYIVQDPERCGTQMTFVIAKIHQAMLDGSHITKRSIYYGNPEIFKNQGVVDRILARLCTWLEVPRWILRVKASGKLKLFGDLTWTRENGKGTCSAKDEILSLPDGDMSELGKKFTCEARFVLVIEKDTIFQKLVNEEFYETYAPCLLMTAKGYPDLQTRCLLAELGKKFTEVPILGLFDADVHGLGVYCTYKYGTQNPTMRNSKLSPVKIEQLELLGVLPSELQSLQIRASELNQLTKADRALLKGIFKRSYFKTDNELAKQVSLFHINWKYNKTIFMSTNGWKAEIEVLESLRTGYLCQEYLVNKLKNKNIFPTAYLR
ncbi:hypothetical protein EG68_11888 [Paragonimus skrjabini miyazakii]|uniref:DNA topoisomerase (ATP-hydrolyzing) n=1 Tax=Paragonimus skrjabini miyazakii TaxID=59628 RepID=A0A8S9YPE2_9TREM|nr:hypothetical protein EG68_11888 [Paragonimus skrjabini miyazakii]